MNQADVKVSFYLKKSEADAKGNCPVMARLNVGKYSEAAFSVKLSVPHTMWHSGRATGKSVAAREINRQLDEIRASALHIYQEQSAIREGVTAEDVKCLLLGMASGLQTFIIAPIPETIIPKGMASESLLADILIDKYVYHLPFYRVIQKYRELGVVLSDSTIGDWFSAVCSRLRPLYDKLRERIMSSDYIQVDESTLPVIDNEKHRAVKGYIWAVRDAVFGDVYFHYDMGSRSGETARRLIGGYRGTVQTDGYEVYEAYEGAPGKRMIGCWAHARRKFVEALDEDRKHASEALVYIGRLYGIENEMQEAGLDAEAIRKRRQDKSYEIIREFEKWMDSVSNRFAPKSRMGKALVYTYTLLPRLSRYVLDGRYHIDNNRVENAIRPLAIGRKNYLFCGNHDAAVRAAIVYSLFSSCKARGIDTRTWLEDTLKRLPTEKDIDSLLPCNFRK